MVMEVMGPHFNWYFTTDQHVRKNCANPFARSSPDPYPARCSRGPSSNRCRQSREGNFTYCQDQCQVYQVKEYTDDAPNKEHIILCRKQDRIPLQLNQKQIFIVNHATGYVRCGRRGTLLSELQGE